MAQADMIINNNTHFGNSLNVVKAFLKERIWG
jgi:hypothetical protein